MQLLSLADAISLDIQQANQLYANHLNPGLLEIYKILGLSEMDVERAEGMDLHLTDGRTILDFSASIGVLGLGHNHPRIIAAEALCHQQKLLDAIKVAPHKMQAALAYNLVQLLPDPLQLCFLTVSGAEAVEAAMKVCERAQGPTKRKFITATGAFHGKTHGALSVTTSGGFQRGFLLGIPPENVIEVPYGDSMALATAIRQQTRSGRNPIIAILLEPIQGQNLEAAPPGYLKEVAALAQANDILTIFDEVKVGMGRTGTFCAFQIEDVVPDVVTLSKALGGGKRAIGAMVTSERVFRQAYGQRKDSSLHTTTFGGLGESCAVAIETLNVLIEDKLIQSAQQKGDYLKTQLLQLQTKYPNQITELLGRGLLQGIRFSFPLSPLGPMASIMMASLLRDLYQQHDIIAHFSASDPEILHIMPPLIVETHHLDRLVAALDDILAQGFLKLASRFIQGNLEQLAANGS